jgi:hypothetical protein
MSAVASVALSARSAVVDRELHEGRIKPVDLLALLEEVKAVVVKSAAGRSTLRVGPSAKRLAELFHEAGFSHARIADELIIAAAQAGVPVEMDRCD